MSPAKLILTFWQPTVVDDDICESVKRDFLPLLATHIVFENRNISLALEDIMKEKLVNEKIVSFLFIVWPIIIIILAITVGIIFRKELQFSPSKLINDVVDFMLGIISMLLSFLFANIYWKKRLEKELSERHKIRLIGYLARINDKIDETMGLINQPIKEDKASLDRDKRAISSCKEIESIGRNTTRFLNDTAIEMGQDNNLAAASANFRQEVEPKILEIGLITKIRPGVDELVLNLNQIKADINRIILTLGGASNEPN